MKKLLLLLFLALINMSGYAQPKAQPANAKEQNNLFITELALPRIIEAALAHSAEIEYLELGKQVALEDVKLTRKNLLNTVSLVSGYNYGTLPYFGVSQSEINSINAFALDARAQYTVGVNMNLPLDVVLGRSTSGNSVQRQKLLVQQSEAAKKAQGAEIREKVIALYQQLLLQKIMLQHYQDAYQSADISKKLADRQFRDGGIKFEEQLAAIKFYNEAFLAQEEAKNEYQTTVLLLEDLIGMNLNDLMHSK